MQRLDAREGLDRAGGKAIAIGVAAKPDHVLGADIGGQQRGADDRPREPAAGKEKIVAAALAGLESPSKAPTECSPPKRSRRSSNRGP